MAIDILHKSTEPLSSLHLRSGSQLCVFIFTLSLHSHYWNVSFCLDNSTR